MNFTERINKAIITATRLHWDQKRKADDLPYIIHPYSVALIVSRYTRDEDTIIAALLHDVLEDVKKEKYPDSQMIKDFGKNVYEIVKGVSEEKDANMTDEEETRTWTSRKKKYIDHLKIDREESLIIACADKIHNIMSLREVYEKSTDKIKILKQFHAPHEKKKHILWYNNAVLSVVKHKLKNPIVTELEKGVNELEKTFIPNL